MLYQTMCRAIDPKDGELKTWIGPRIEAMSQSEAKHKIREFGYLRVTGLLLSEIDEETGEQTKLIIEN